MLAGDLTMELAAHEIKRQSNRLRALEWLGKWSMHDVLVLALTIFFIKSQGVYDASSLNGVYFFTAAILFMIPYGISIAATVRVGHAVGRRDPAADVARAVDAKEAREDEQEKALAAILEAPVVFLGVGLPDDRIHAPNEKADIEFLLAGAEAAAYLWTDLADTWER